MNRFYKALTSHRDKLARGEKGFTLIELLIVVIIIGVLAAIAIPIYLNVQQTAKDNSAKQSVADAKTAITAAYTQTGTLPTSLSGAAPTGAGYTVDSSSITIKYVPGTGGAFCVSANYSGSTTTYVSSNSTAVTTGTACTGTNAP